MNHVLEYPFTPSRILKLKAGDRVLVSGRVFTARDRLHQYLCESKSAAVDLKSGAIYHCGPIMVRKKGKWNVLAAGPTTSIRAETYMPEIIRRYRITVIIGKGGMGKHTLQSCARHHCVYLQAVGGAAQVLAMKITEVRGVHFLKEFGPTEAMWELVFKDFPAIVTMDAHGNSLHAQMAGRSARNLRKLLYSKTK